MALPDTEHMALSEFIQGNEGVLKVLFGINGQDDPTSAASEMLKRIATDNHAKGVASSDEALQALAKVVVEMAKKANAQALACITGVMSAAIEGSHSQEVVDNVLSMVHPHHREEEHGHEHALTADDDDAHQGRYHEKAKPRFEGPSGHSSKPTERTALLDLEQGKRSEVMPGYMRDRWLVFYVTTVPAICGVFYALALWYHYPKMVHYMGVGILVSRGCAMSLVVLTALKVVLMCRRCMTAVQASKLAEIPMVGAFIDESVFVHRTAGYLLTLFSLLHILGHCVGSIPALLESESLDEINNHMLHGSGKLDYNPMTIRHILKTGPAITGIALVATLVLIVVTSLEVIRRRWFRLFQNLHEFFFYTWFVMLYMHGKSQWLGMGIPLVVPVCGLPLLIYTWERLTRAITPESGIRKAVVSDRLIYIETAKHIQFELGQYAQLQIPEVNYEWHPFTICSSPSSGHACFLIAQAGNWTKAVAQRLKKQPYPQFYCTSGFGAPSMGLPRCRYLVMIGSGVGVTPFMAALQELVQSHKAKEPGGLHELVKGKFMWITREPEDFHWVSNYVAYAGATDLHKRVDIQLILTSKLHSVPESVMFWQAVKVVSGGDRDGAAAVRSSMQSGGSAAAVPTRFGRPDFEKEISSFVKDLPKDAFVHTFVCGNRMLADNVANACEVVNSHGGPEVALHQEQF